jgi:hypothetical protein
MEGRAIKQFPSAARSEAEEPVKLSYCDEG